VEIILPNGLRLLSGATNNSIGTLAANGSRSVSLTATARVNSALPKTGDDFPISLLLGLLLASMGGMVALLIYRKKAAAKTLTLFLCAALALSAMAPAALAATAPKSFSLQEPVQVSGANQTITAKITYDWEYGQLPTPVIVQNSDGQSISYAVLGAARYELYADGVLLTANAIETVTFQALADAIKNTTGLEPANNVTVTVVAVGTPPVSNSLVSNGFIVKVLPPNPVTIGIPQVTGTTTDTITTICFSTVANTTFDIVNVEPNFGGPPPLKAPLPSIISGGTITTDLDGVLGLGHDMQTIKIIVRAMADGYFPKEFESTFTYVWDSVTSTGAFEL